jgi:hypothetical protein
MLRKTLATILAVAGLLLINPTAASALSFYRWSVNGFSYYHYGNPALGEVRVDTWVGEATDLATVDKVQAVSRAVKIRGAARVQVNVVRLEDLSGEVLIRQDRAVNSGTASYAYSSTLWRNVGFEGECITPVPLRVRTNVSIRWSDGTLSTVTRVGPFTTREWCYPDPTP